MNLAVCLINRGLQIKALRPQTHSEALCSLLKLPVVHDAEFLRREVGPQGCHQMLHRSVDLRPEPPSSGSSGPRAQVLFLFEIAFGFCCRAVNTGTSAS